MSRTRRLITLLLVPMVASVLFGCGSNSEDGGEEPDAGLTAIKSYLTEHTADLVTRTAALKAASDAYYDLAKANRFQYARLLRSDRQAVNAALTDAKNAFIKANSAYEEVAGVVAGIPRTAQYDTDIETGSDGSDPGNAVSFNLKLPDGKVMEQPGNLFSLIESSLYGTNAALTAKGVRPDINGDGKAEFGEGLPEAGALRATVGEMYRQANDLHTDAQDIVISPSDAFTVVAVMTPTMSEYFEEWKRSAFVAGEGRQQEDGFVATSRLSDIADVLTGLDFTYGEIEPLIAEENRDQAERTASELGNLLESVAGLRDREAAGEKFTPAQADELGAEAQSRAERIAGQVRQAARDLDIEIQDD